MLRTKEVETLPEQSKTKQQQNKRQKLARTIRRIGEGSHTGDLNPYALNATITTTVRVLQNATNATKLAILLVTVGVREMPTMLTIQRGGGTGGSKLENLLASSVESRNYKRDCPKLKNNKKSGNQLSDKLKELYGNRLYKTLVLNPGELGLVCQEEGRIILDVH
ncbi:hypothetical protein Tco_1191501 [Tanacetum coccineum]